MKITGNKCLLDTSVIIHCFKQNNQIVEKLDTLEEIYVPVTLVGELYFGAYKSGDAVKHIAQIESFLANCKILVTDSITSNLYGKIKAALAKKGKPIPENDIWIGAAALQYNIPLFTADKHFQEIDGLDLL